jgi:membrane protein implicated in regulation of membrane protease activity
MLLLELVLPGGIVAALGLTTLLIGLLIWLGWVTTFVNAIVIWTVVGIAALLALRPIMQRLFPSETIKGSFEEDDDLRGTLVDVIETIADGNPGRVLVRGTSWAAKLMVATDVAPAHTKVLLIERKNITWFVAIPPIEKEGTPL